MSTGFRPGEAAWETPEKIGAALAHFEGLIPGWRAPAAYGVACVVPPGAARFPVVNRDDHALPAVVLGLVVGRVDETGTYPLSVDRLDRAIATLAPAEAAAMYQHPNIAAWRELRAELAADPLARAVAVFVADLDDPSSGPHDDVLRARLTA
ncbi:hypothetical protein ABH926_003299 [Catenulispora sp. GP43]|uniref:hypothetical protein n=1 Tax=Catenulispora sp. GP43 TaxID=3156263 RepID=UPI00351308C4